MKVQVHIRLRPDVLDPQGKAIGQALGSIGFAGVSAVRQGKLIEMEVASADRASAKAEVEAMCQRLLANPVIEDYEIEIED